MDWTDVIKLIASIVICEAAGGLGAVFTTPAIPAWYRSLKKPSFTPPNAAFGPVWGTLYLLMGISLFFVWKEDFGLSGVLEAFSLFWAQLAFNILWSFIFFGRRSPAGGLAIIVFLWLLILATIVLSFRVSAVAGGLLIPYIIWVSIAANLNLQIWRLNRN